MDEFVNDLGFDVSADVQRGIVRVVITQMVAPTAELYLAPDGMRRLAAELINSAELVDLEMLWARS